MESLKIIPEAKEALPWEGKVCNCLGDSITYGYDPDDPSGRLDNPWPSQLERLCGFSKVNNYGISGDTVAKFEGKNSMSKRYVDMEQADVIIFKGGVNDFSLDVPLGTFDPNSTDTTNYYGALNVIFKGLLVKYPTSSIMVMTQLDWINGDIPNANGNKLEEFREAVREVAKYYCIPVFELALEAGFTPKIEGQKTALIPDGLHPNQAGVNIMARKISKYVNNRL